MTTLALLDQSLQWWDELNLARQIFYGIGIVAGIFSLILALLAAIGMEHHDAVDVGSMDADHDGAGIFSVKPMTGFFLGFGWGGGLALDAELPMIAAIAIGVGCGGTLMAVIVAMYRAIRAMRSDGTMRIADAMDATGTVYVSLPPARAPGGQVIVNFNGRQETLSALNATDQPIASGERIRVVEVIDSRTVVVKPL